MFADVVVLIGLLLITYAFLDLIGINIFYAVKLLNSKVRKRRKEFSEFIRDIINERLNLVLRTLNISTSSSDIGVPKVILNLRESRRPGGRYFWGLHIITIDIPKGSYTKILPVLDHELTHYVQDILNIKGPKWYIEGMAIYVELRLHGQIRGYYNELRRLLNQGLKPIRSFLIEV